MLRQRPVPSRNVGAVACLVLVLGVLSGCAPSKVQIDSPTLKGADAAACSRLVDDLPNSLADQHRRTVEPESAYGAAWGGNTAIVLRCGVPTPKGFDRFATCQVTNGVAWFIPEAQITGEPADIVMTTVGRTQNVEVVLPKDHWPPAAAMVDLAPAIKRSIREVKPCL